MGAHRPCGAPCPSCMSAEVQIASHITSHITSHIASHVTSHITSHLTKPLNPCSSAETLCLTCHTSHILPPHIAPPHIPQLRSPPPASSMSPGLSTIIHYHLVNPNQERSHSQAPSPSASCIFFLLITPCNALSLFHCASHPGTAYLLLESMGIDQTLIMASLW